MCCILTTSSYLKRMARSLNRILSSRVFIAMMSVFSGLFLQCSKPFPEGGAVSLLSLATAVDHYIFATAATYDGDLRTAGGGATGIEGADNLCALAKDNEQPALPGTGSEYRALLIDSGNRVACTSINCAGGSSEHVDWVLRANTSYKRPDGTVVFTTNASGIFLMTAGLNAPLAAAGQWWTGMDDEWNDVGNTCTDWTGTAGTGFFGIGGSTIETAITDNALGEPCASALSLLCVR